ncbi:hypothetical protein V495_06746 [Pseudogymnoascus sp. VKM F-4514 (FW-929)]|nr:hypothetical protein V495_06746 [Pseudogymnoascus sp. VKM F-4514 (FW-929)]KFY51430.1 hypothetical protein V497_09153 [Pseudogymnoascus sp. VKM F-4516 (FW-969)]
MCSPPQPTSNFPEGPSTPPRNPRTHADDTASSLALNPPVSATLSSISKSTRQGHPFTAHLASASLARRAWSACHHPSLSLSITARLQLYHNLHLPFDFVLPLPAAINKTSQSTTLSRCANIPKTTTSIRPVKTQAHTFAAPLSMAIGRNPVLAVPTNDSLSFQVTARCARHDHTAPLP